MTPPAPLPPRSVAGLLVRLSSRDRLRRLNRVLMVPIFRSGLGWLLGDPLGGWIMVLRTRGRRSGRIREAGLDYVLDGGNVYCLAGFGPNTSWFLNLLAEPRVEVILPGRTFVGRAAEVADAEERARVVPRLIRASGVAGLMVGGDPWTMSDERILAALDGFPLVRIGPTGIVAGPADPGGWLWVLKLGLSAYLIRRVLRRDPSRAAPDAGGPARRLRRR